ncbi:MAG TPA: carboxypeptidase regulatory-like domain-containing protein [Acidobacteriota bacterium]|nr:carboxypeptidase regulatory-like domain-containing protein [Acidobacteriota bacterium]
MSPSFFIWTKRFLVFLIALALGAPLMAQTVSGTISGTVVDPSGQVIPGSTVSLINEATGDSRTMLTSDEGSFVFTAVQPGSYTVKVEQVGFAIFERKGNKLTANEHLSVGNLTLKIGEMSETITTTAEGTPVQTDSTEHSALVTAKQLELVSIRGRDVTELLRVLPGVTYREQGESAGNSFGSSSPNIQGGRDSWNTFNVDGVRGNDLGSPRIFSSTVNFDAIDEVKVLLNSYQAEYGGNSGASVNIVTKSGTSDYHGSAYWFKRHEKFNANNFFNNANGVKRPRYRFNTFGGTLGGPVWLPHDKLKDKLFFFYSLEIAQNQNPQPLRQVTVPTALERKGDFSQSRNQAGQLILIKDPLSPNPCTSSNQSGCFPGNIIPANRINSNGQAILKVFPLPNFVDPTGNFNYTFQESIKIPKNQNLLRVDYKASEKDSFYVRASTWYADNQGIAVPAGTANWGLSGLHYTFTDNGILGNWTRIITPTIVNEASLGVRHSVEDGPPLSDAELAKMQRSTYGFTLGQFHSELNPLGVIPRASFGSVPVNPAAITYDGRYPLRGADTFITFGDTISIIRGAHTYKGGFYFERARNYEGATATFAGDFDFSRDTSNPNDTGHGYANGLLGNFRQYTESTTRPSGEGRQSLIEWFAQDSWKVNRRLRLEYGARFAWFQQWYHNVPGKAAAFALERYDRSKAPLLFRPAIAGGTRVAQNPVTGATFPAVFIGAIVPGTGDPYNGMVVATDAKYPRGFKEPPGLLIQPRFGFAWDLRGNGKTALRASVGVFHNTRTTANTVWNVMRNPPIQDNPLFFYGSMDTLLSATGVLAPSNVQGFDRHSDTPVTYNYTMGVQHEIGFNTVLDIAYVGSVGRHLQGTVNLNTLPFGARFDPKNFDPTLSGNRPLPDNFLRPFPGIGNITYYETASTSNYNALQVAANRRFTSKLQYGVAYTWSKAMDYGDGDTDGLARYRSRRVWNYGRAGFDETHVMVINYTYDLPKVSNLWSNGFTRYALDDWQVSGITAFASGQPRGISFSTSDNADITGGGDGSRVVITGNPNLDSGNRGLLQWFNTSVIKRPAQGDPGNAPKDVFRGPGFNNWDFSLFKNIPVTEKGKLQLRWELYNAFNHTQFDGVDNAARFDASGGQINQRFGRVTSARNPRQMQFSARLTF